MSGRRAGWELDKRGEVPKTRLESTIKSYWGAWASSYNSGEVIEEF